MLANLAAIVACLAPLALAQTTNGETIIGVYMFHRHGDRTPKYFPPANLTDLGYAQVYASGEYYRSRYIASDADYRINGVNSDLVKQSQIAVSAPSDNVLMNSAQGFLQGLYPPVGSQLGSNALRNGTTVEAPLNGYQLIPVAQVVTGGGSEDNTWLQSASGCLAATVSSNNYFSSNEYNNLLSSTQDFYHSILPVINGSFSASTDNFKNGYIIWDIINVAQIHNVTNYNSSDLITGEVFHQLYTLANAHEWGLAYNASDDARAMAGKVLAGQIVQFLNGTLTSGGKQKIGVQFGAYGTFASFFGLAGLPAVNVDFTGIVDYASSMAFELFTNDSSSASASTNPDNTFVRFVFHNGTASAASPPTTYPLFGSASPTLRWADFVAGMTQFAVSDTREWCTACANFTGTCAAYAPSGSGAGSASSAASSSSSNGGNGLSPAVNGVIGAMVTLAVVLAAALVFVASGFRVVSKKRFAQSTGAAPMGKVAS